MPESLFNACALRLSNKVARRNKGVVARPMIAARRKKDLRSKRKRKVIAIRTN